MVKNSPLLADLERRLAAGEKADPSRNFRILDALYEEARDLGAFPLRDKLDGLDVDIRIARVVNRLKTTPAALQKIEELLHDLDKRPI
jgi:hypothetical protein